MQILSVNSNNPDAKRLVSEYLNGKYYRKVIIFDFYRGNLTDMTTLEEQTKDRLVITYRNEILCDPVPTIRISVLDCGETLLRSIPNFIFESADVIISGHGREYLATIGFANKYKQYSYFGDEKHLLVPNSMFIAREPSDLEGVNFSLISRLVLDTDYSKLMDMAKILGTIQDHKFNKISLKYRLGRFTNRNSCQAFDISLLSNVRTRKLQYNYAKYTGIWKYIANSETSIIIRTDYGELDVLSAEMLRDSEQDEVVDISENYTLTTFETAHMHPDDLRKIEELCTRNRLIQQEIRFKSMKAIMSPEPN